MWTLLYFIIPAFLENKKILNIILKTRTSIPKSIVKVLLTLCESVSNSLTMDFRKHVRILIRS